MSYRRKQRDSAYFTEPTQPPKIPKKARDIGKDFCIRCGEEVLWEEAIRLQPGDALAHPECQQRYRSTQSRYRHADPSLWEDLT